MAGVGWSGWRWLEWGMAGEVVSVASDEGGAKRPDDGDSAKPDEMDSANADKGDSAKPDEEDSAKIEVDSAKPEEDSAKPGEDSANAAVGAKAVAAEHVAKPAAKPEDFVPDIPPGQKEFDLMSLTALFFSVQDGAHNPRR